MIASSLLLAAAIATAPHSEAAATTLHDQMDSAGSTSTRSQNFETAFDSYDDEAADDFEVPAGQTWDIGQVDVGGSYSGTSIPTGVNVRFYAENEGLPGGLVAERLDVQPTGGFTSPNFSLPLGEPVKLAPGFYWLSVQANLVSGSHWFWTNRSVVKDESAVYRNPGGGHETLCDEWNTREDGCAPGGGLSTTDGDQVFRLIAADEAETIKHQRGLSIRFNDGTGARNNGLVVYGRLRLFDGSFTDCISQQPVDVQRETDNGWKTIKSTNTNRRGRYAVEVEDKAARYRVIAPQTKIVDEDLNKVDVCLKVEKEKNHRHA